MKLFFRPFEFIATIVGLRLGQRLFDALWSKVGDEDEPPQSTAGDAPLSEVLLSSVLRAATFAAVAAVVERTAASTFHYLFGAWPSRSRAEKAQAGRRKS